MHTAIMPRVRTYSRFVFFLAGSSFTLENLRCIFLLWSPWVFMALLAQPYLCPFLYGVWGLYFWNHSSQFLLVHPCTSIKCCCNRPILSNFLLQSLTVKFWSNCFRTSQQIWLGLSHARHSCSLQVYLIGQCSLSFSLLHKQPGISFLTISCVFVLNTYLLICVLIFEGVSQAYTFTNFLSCLVFNSNDNNKLTRKIKDIMKLFVLHIKAVCTCNVLYWINEITLYNHPIY